MVWTVSNNAGTYRLLPSGGTYSWKYTRSPATIFGPFEDIRREALVERLVARRRAPGEEAVAEGCAGAPSNFIKPPSSRYGITINWPDRPEPEPEPEEEEEGDELEIPPEVHTAVGWELQAVRIENPDDPEQHVNTTRILQARFRRQNGTEYRQDYRPIMAAINAASV